ncbi:MAG: murein L,D-transpeptidase catalytic domain family protein, partial [Bdellovibrionota bacterium]
KRYVILIDMNRHSSVRRFYLFDLVSGKVERHNVAHGAGSDPRASGYAKFFSNVSGSDETALGAYRTASTYLGIHGLQLRLDGLENTNSRARDRGIVLHGANYVADGTRAGRSWGCPALDPHVSTSVINRVKGGAMLLIWK